jgi:multidrug efflux pump subunit AcrB
MMLKFITFTALTMLLMAGSVQAFETEEGGEMLQPMAVAAIGGLRMKILVALFVMPCLYIISKRQTRGKDGETI